MSHDDQRQVPVGALCFAANQFELGDNGDNAKTAPFRMVARSGLPIDHWYWGRVVHDMSGLKHKPRIPIDYAHDDKEIVGYANRFDVESGDLVISGALVPYKDSDRASEIVHKYKAGVPYEASINFGGDGLQLEEIPKGSTTQVNGHEFSGPGIVVRSWPLRGVAVCPYGADANTSAEFSNSETITVKVSRMSSPTQELEAAAASVVAVESQPDPAETVEEKPEEEKPEGESVEAEPVANAQLSQQDKPGLRYLAAFGDQGGVWFAQGLSWEEASAKYVESLKTENALLRQKLAASQAVSGEQEPISYSDRVPPKKQLPLVRIQGKRYDE